MLQLRRSILAVAAAERPRLMPPGVLAGFVMLVGAALALMFPYQVLLDQVLHDTRDDELTTRYLQTLLRTNPASAQLRLQLAQRQIMHGDFAAARKTLGPILLAHDPAQAVEARLTMWEIAEQEWLRLPEADPRQASALQSLRHELRELDALPLNEQARVRLAGRALELGDRKLALSFYRHAAREGAQFDAGWFEELARAHIGEGEYEVAAEVYMLARHRASTLAGRRTNFMAAVNALRQENRPGDALALAERELGDLGNDADSIEFMTRLALAAGRPDIASKYARMLLKLALLDQLRQARLEDAGVITLAAYDTSPSEPTPRLPFDDRRYTLGYEVFLANGEQDEAYRVAASAVRQAPEASAWRKRLAQAAEWTARPAEALQQWRWLAEHGGGDEATQALLRLAPGLLDDDALLLGLRRQLLATPNDAKLLQALIATYERQGDTEGGIATLQKIAHDRPSPAVLQSLADLAERAGQLTLVIATLQDMDQRFGPNPARAFRRAGLHMQRGELRQAYEAMLAVQGQVAATDAQFWQRFGRLAQMRQDEPNAIAAYERLTQLAEASEYDYDVLIELLASEAPLRAAALSELAWQRFPKLDRVVRTLDLYASVQAWPRFAQVLQSLNGATLSQAEADPRFIRLRATYWQGTGQANAALADLRHLLALAPDDANAREAYLWQLIDQHEVAALRAVLVSHEEVWARDPSLHDALAAAWQTLSAPQTALDRYLTARASTHRGDFLWLMNYADVLEQNHQADQAWQIRTALWRNRKPASERAKIPPAALVRLASSMTPGDPALAVLRQLMRLDRAAPNQPGSVADELALAWQLAQAQPEAAQAYLVKRYARHLAVPLWAEIASAAANGDTARSNALLERWGAALPVSERISIARAAGDEAQAASLAFEAQQTQRDDDALHLQLTELLDAQATRVTVGTEFSQLDRWREQATVTELALQATPRLRLSAELGNISRSVDASLGNIPGERYGTLALAWRSGETSLAAQASSHNAAQVWSGVQVSARQPLSQQFYGVLTLGWRQSASESSLLRALGWRDQAGMELGWKLDMSNRLALQWQVNRYATQTATPLGYGHLTTVNFSHAFRQEDRDVQGELYATRYRTQAVAPGHESGYGPEPIRDRLPHNSPGAQQAEALLPRSFDLIGARLSTGTRLATAYTRAWRPYGALGLHWNSDSGVGYDISVGASGSVLGADHLAIGARYEKGATTNLAPNTATTVVGVRYWIDY